MDEILIWADMPSAIRSDKKGRQTVQLTSYRNYRPWEKMTHFVCVWLWKQTGQRWNVTWWSQPRK